MKLAEVVLPIRTRNPLNQSQGITRGGMFARAKERKAQRGLAQLALSPMRKRLEEHLADGRILVITLTRIAPSCGLDPEDGLTASMKSVRDGIADLCGLGSDRHPQLRWQYGQERGKRGDYAVRVEIGLFVA